MTVRQAVHQFLNELFDGSVFYGNDLIDYVRQHTGRAKLYDGTITRVLRKIRAEDKQFNYRCSNVVKSQYVKEWR